MNMRWRCGGWGHVVHDPPGRLDLNALFDPDMLGDDLEAWLAESALMKRTFRTCAIISGLIARRFTGEEKSRRQVLFSTDLIYDVLRKHQADHVLLRARGRTPPPGCSISSGWVICSPAFTGESPIGNSTVFRRWRCR
jgi:hypothetical protein